MANLPDETITTTEQYGETQATIPPLDQLPNGRERLRSSYSRLYTIMLRVAESQPTADSAILNLLFETIERSQATIPAVEASVQEAKRDLNLP